MEERQKGDGKYIIWSFQQKEISFLVCCFSFLRSKANSIAYKWLGVLSFRLQIIVMWKSSKENMENTKCHTLEKIKYMKMGRITHALMCGRVRGRELTSILAFWKLIIRNSNALCNLNTHIRLMIEVMLILILLELKYPNKMPEEKVMILVCFFYFHFLRFLIDWCISSSLSSLNGRKFDFPMLSFFFISFLVIIPWIRTSFSSNLVTKQPFK